LPGKGDGGLGSKVEYIIRLGFLKNLLYELGITEIPRQKVQSLFYVLNILVVSP
jgi:hypothetical protein